MLYYLAIASSFFFCTKAIIDICLGFADDVFSLGVPDPDAGDEPFLDLALLTGLVLVSCLLLLVLSAVCCIFVCVFLRNFCILSINHLLSWIFQSCEGTAS